MRRRDREIQSFDEMMKVVQTCDCCRLGLVDEENSAYIVPMNFGAENSGSSLVLYFHSAQEGKKIELLKKNPIASFEMDSGHGVKAGESACDYSFRYSSAMGRGRVEFIDNAEDKIHAFEKIMQKYGAVNRNFNEKAVEKTCVFRLIAEQWSCKANR